MPSSGAEGVGASGPGFGSGLGSGAEVSPALASDALLSSDTDSDLVSRVGIGEGIGEPDSTLGILESVLVSCSAIRASLLTLDCSTAASLSPSDTPETWVRVSVRIGVSV